MEALYLSGGAAAPGPAAHSTLGWFSCFAKADPAAGYPQLPLHRKLPQGIAVPLAGAPQKSTTALLSLGTQTVEPRATRRVMAFGRLLLLLGRGSPAWQNGPGWGRKEAAP